MSHLLLIWLLLTPQSLAQTSISTQDAIVELNAAVKQYQLGNRSEAVQLLLSISMNNDYPQGVRQEARIYIAEILFVEGNPNDARNMFIETLNTDPNYNIDRFRHPPEICELFDQVKQQYISSPIGISVPPQPKKFPLSGYSPFGIYHFQQQKLWKGLSYSSLQLATGVTSITLFAYLLQNPSYVQDNSTEKKRMENILQVQRISTILFYSLWATSVIDAQRDWQMSVNIMPSQDGASLLFRYQF
jgi:hypothetical protein